ncbi:MAG: peptidase, partial [Candidatus Aminicenantes bacterium]|nr:peptidase [Candidatus Aminicenantes bacterium]
PPSLAIKEQLEKSTLPGDKDYLRFLMINFGPFDRQDENKPFIGTAQKPAGAGFYPSDLTKQEFEDYIAKNPGEKEQLESSFTVIKRQDGKLVAVPYPSEYKDDLERVAQTLREAAGLTTNPSLQNYLTRRAQDLLSNDYFESDCLWIDLKDNLAEIVIGPFEVYEDGLMGIKASYESFVYVNDRQEMKKIKGYLDYLDEMQTNLPVEQKYKDQKVRGLDSPLNVVYEVFTAGDTKAGVQTSAFVLPNDEKVREKKGTKKVFLKNMMEAKFKKSLVPISERVLEPDDAQKVSFDAYFTETILHEISHVLGVNYVTLPDGTKTTVNKILKDLNTPISEAKADVVGIYNVPLLVEKVWFPKKKETEIYTTYLAGMFRSMRFGATEAHGLGVLLQFNFLREKGAFVYDAAAMKFKLDSSKIQAAVRELARHFLILEGDGNYDNVRKFIDRYGKMDDITKQMIEKLADIPVDIAPIFKTSY